MENNSLSERVKFLLNTKGHTVYSFCKETGYSDATMSQLMTKNQKPNEKNIKLILDYFQVSREWLLNGDGEMYYGEISFTKKPPENPPDELSSQAIMTKLVLSNEKLVFQNGELIKILSEQTSIIKNNSDTINNLSYKVSETGETVRKKASGGQI